MKIYFHPPLVHFPIAFNFLELLLLAVWARKKIEYYRQIAFLVFGLSYFVMIPTALAGFVDAGGMSGMTGGVRIHAFTVLATFLFYSLRGLHWMRADPAARFYSAFQLSGALLGNLLTFAAAFWGGQLVYS